MIVYFVFLMTPCFPMYSPESRYMHVYIKYFRMSFSRFVGEIFALKIWIGHEQKLRYEYFRYFFKIGKHIE